MCFCVNTGGDPAPYSMLALRGLGLAAGSRVLVSDVAAGFALKLQLSGEQHSFLRLVG